MQESPDSKIESGFLAFGNQYKKKTACTFEGASCFSEIMLFSLTELFYEQQCFYESTL